jgi:hypothetical protein
MSRVLFGSLLLFLPAATFAQAESQTESEIAAFVKTKSNELLKVEGREPKKCPDPVEGEDIVVCGVVDDGADQLVFGDRPANEDRIRPGEAISTKKAASCIGGYTACGHRLHQLGGIGFGNVPPPAIPLEEVYRGLPEPDMIVPEGSPADYAGPVSAPEQ